ncbi:MAG: hypothetical protein M4579_007390 [Chaenotheca gracillima]|nr:MAG: hypothetical protein M4579_007390 [Chaenotheca gracillima]
MDLPQDTKKLQLIEQVWAIIVQHFSHGVNEVLVPFDVAKNLGCPGMAVIEHRYSVRIGARAIVFSDKTLQCIRMVQPLHVAPVPLNFNPAVDISDSIKAATDMISNTAPTHGRIPRPPNAFILYRQHHHPLVKGEHPEMRNNDISIILGRQWRDEQPAIKDSFKAMAEKLKQQHLKDHPNYQYQPRKPSEKKRRATRPKTETSKGKIEEANDEDLNHGVSGVSDSDDIEPDIDPDVKERRSIWAKNVDGTFSLELPTNDHNGALETLIDDFNGNLVSDDANGDLTIEEYLTPAAPYAITSAKGNSTDREKCLKEIDWNLVDADILENDGLMNAQEYAEALFAVHNPSPNVNSSVELATAAAQA